jgi:SAM-dependent methyltransferase
MSSFAARCQQFQQWLTTPTGRGMLIHEKKCMNVKLRELGGYQLLQVSADNHVLFHKSLAANKVLLSLTTPVKSCTYQILGDAESWPIATESINVLILHHALDMVENPHMFLREATRVLAPGGYIICCGFNPWSVLGLKRLFNPKIRKGNYISARRLKDWFQLLGFDVREEQHLLYTNNYQKIERKLQRYNLPLGGVYLITLRKCVQSVTPVMSLWKKQKAPLVAISSFTRTQLKKPTHF